MKEHNKKKIAIVLWFGMVLTSCDYSSTETNTERFYESPWSGEVIRYHEPVSTLPAEGDTVVCFVNFDKDGGLTFQDNTFDDHAYQSWQYSWSADKLFFNYTEATEWFMNASNDSLYAKYNYYGYDYLVGIGVDWTYELRLSK